MDWIFVLSFVRVKNEVNRVNFVWTGCVAEGFKRGPQSCKILLEMVYYTLCDKRFWLCRISLLFKDLIERDCTQLVLVIYLWDLIGTKEATKIPFLDEQPLEDLRGSKLLLKMDVFHFFFFLYHVNGLPLKDTSRQVVLKTKEFWEQGGIKTKYDGCSKDDVESV